MYPLLRRTLFLFDAEKVHYFTTFLLKFLLKFGFTRIIFKKLFVLEDPKLERTVFGLSYGGWTKSLPWDNKNVDLICVESNDKTVELFIDTYLKRTMTPEEVEESLNMHIHDHHQDDEDYRKHIYNIVGEKAIRYAQDNQQIEFWQLQYCFHHGGDRLLEKDEIDIMKKKYYNAIMEAQSFTTLNHDRIKYYDIFNLDLKKISEDLNIEYVDKMQQEYNVFIDFSDMVFNDRQF